MPNREAGSQRQENPIKGGKSQGKDPKIPISLVNFDFSLAEFAFLWEIEAPDRPSLSESQPGLERNSHFPLKDKKWNVARKLHFFVVSPIDVEFVDALLSMKFEDIEMII